MDYKLLEAWLSELMPPDHKKVVRELVHCIQQNAPLQFSVAMNALYPSLIHIDGEVRSAALNGLLTGITLASAWQQNSFVIETGLKGFLEHRSKLRGENVFDFYKGRAEKR